MGKVLRNTPDRRKQKHVVRSTGRSTPNSPQPLSKKKPAARPTDQNDQPGCSAKKMTPTRPRNNDGTDINRQNKNLVSISRDVRNRSSSRSTVTNDTKPLNRIKDAMQCEKIKKTSKINYDVGKELAKKCKTNEDHERSSSLLTGKKEPFSPLSKKCNRSFIKIDEKKGRQANILKPKTLDLQSPTTTRRAEKEKTIEENEKVNSPSSTTSKRARKQIQVKVQNQCLQSTYQPHDPQKSTSPSSHTHQIKKHTIRMGHEHEGSRDTLPSASKVSNKQTKVSIGNTIQTPESQQKRELRNLEDFWTMQDSPSKERHLRSGTKLDKSSTQIQNDQSVQGTSGTTARRKITFSDAEENDAERNLDDNYYLPPKKKLRSQTKPCELWSGLPDQCQQRVPHKLKSKDDQKSVQTNLLPLGTGKSINDITLPVQGKIPGLSMRNKEVERTNDEMEEPADSTLNETVIYSELDNSISEKIERGDLSETKKVSINIFGGEPNKFRTSIASPIVGTHFSVTNNRSSVDPSHASGYMVLPRKERESTDINTQYMYECGPFNNKFKEYVNDKIVHPSVSFQNNEDFSPNDMPVKSVNKVIVSNPFASHSDTQIYVSILNRKDGKVNEVSDVVSNNKQYHTSTSRSEENMKNRNLQTGHSVPRNDKMVSLLKDMNVIYARMNEKFAKPLSNNSNKMSETGNGVRHFTNGSFPQGSLAVADSSVYASPHATKSKDDIGIPCGPISSNDGAVNLSEIYGIEKELSDAEFFSVSELAVTDSTWPDCGVTTDASSLSQASEVSGSASTAVLLNKINSMLETIDSAESKNCNLLNCVDKEYAAPSGSKEGTKTSDHFELTRTASDDNSCPSVSQTNTLNAITPKRSARLQEKRVSTPKEDGSTICQTDRKENEKVGTQTSKNRDCVIDTVGSDILKPEKKPLVKCESNKVDGHDGIKGIIEKPKTSVPNHRVSSSKSRKSDSNTKHGPGKVKSTQNKDLDKKVNAQKSKIMQKETDRKSNITIQSPEIKIKIKRTADGVIHAQTIIDGSTTTAVSTETNVPSENKKTCQKNSESRPAKGTKKTVKISKRQHSGMWGTSQNDASDSSDSACEDCDRTENDKTILEFKEAYENIQNHMNLKSERKKRKEKTNKSAKSKKKKRTPDTKMCKQTDMEVEPSKINTEENCKPKSSKQRKQKANSNKKNKSKDEHRRSVNDNSAVSGIHGNQGQDDLLKNQIIGKHACILWSSEHRRHFQQTNSDASSCEVEEKMRDAWEALTDREKLRYYQRAKNAMKDENKHSLKKKVEKPTEPGSDDLRAATFIKLPTTFQYSQLRKWLRFFHEVSPSDYTIFIEDFKKTLKSEKSSMKQSNEYEKEIDLHGRYRKLLFEKISDSKEKFRQLYEMKRDKQKEKLKDHYHVLVRKLIKGDEIEFPKDFRSEGLSDTLTDLRSLENSMTISVTGTPIMSKSYDVLLENLKYSPSENSDNGAIYSPTDEVVNDILSQVSEENFPVIDPNMIDGILENESESSMMTSEQMEKEVISLLVEFFENQANEAFYRWQSGDAQNCCEMKSPSCILSDLVVAEHLKQFGSSVVQPSQINDILRRSNELGPIAFGAGGFNIISIPNAPRNSLRNGATTKVCTEDDPSNSVQRSLRSEIYNTQRLRMANQSRLRGGKIIQTQPGTIPDRSLLIDNIGMKNTTLPVGHGMTSLLNTDNMNYSKMSMKYEDVSQFNGPHRITNRTYTIGLTPSEKSEYNNGPICVFKDSFPRNRYNIRSKPIIVKRDLSSMMQPDSDINNSNQCVSSFEPKHHGLRQTKSEMDVQPTATLVYPKSVMSRPDLRSSHTGVGVGGSVSDLGLYTPVLRSGNTRGPFIYATGRSEDIQMAKRYQQLLNEQKVE